MHRSSLPLSLFLLLFSIGVASAQEGPYSFVPKKAYRYVTEMKMDMLQEIMGQSIDMTLDSRTIVRLVADTVFPNGTLHIRQTIDSALTHVESPMGSQTVGKESEGKTFGYTMRRDGKIVGRDAGDDNGIPAGLMQMAGSLGSFLPSFEGAILTEGKTWVDAGSDTTGNGSDPMIVSRRNTYTVKERKSVRGRDCLEIAFTGTNSVNGMMEQGGMSIRMEIEGTQSGVLFYDAAAGLLVEMTSKITQDARYGGDGTGETFSGTSTSNGTSSTVFLPE
jgi:hypothetical protein